MEGDARCFGVCPLRRGEEEEEREKKGEGGGGEERGEEEEEEGEEGDRLPWVGLESLCGEEKLENLCCDAAGSGSVGVGRVTSGTIGVISMSTNSLNIFRRSDPILYRTFSDTSCQNRNSRKICLRRYSK